MSKLADFFKESHTALGVFYPLHCLVAVFHDLQEAQQIRTKLLEAGFAPDTVTAVEGNELLELEKEESGLGSTLMKGLSRFLATEQVSTDHNLDFAQQNAGFVIVYCPSQELKSKAWAVMEPEAPLAAHYYERMGVEHLAGGFVTEE